MRLSPLHRGRMVIATRNPGKLEEFARLLAPFAVQVMAATDLGLAEPEETGASFAENALIKARAAATASGMPALADDSGLVVAGLDGAPGIHSARWAGPERDYAAAFRRIHDELVARFGSFAAADRRAAFVCVLALALPEGETALFGGRIDGEIVFPPRGEAGFGYDPIFVPQGESRTFAEMSSAEKDAVSHRGQALRAFVRALAATG